MDLIKKAAPCATLMYCEKAQWRNLIRHTCNHGRDLRFYSSISMRFFASVEQLDHPAWRGKPVIVGGDADKHGVVSTASYEARAMGFIPNGRIAARELCPQAIWTHGHFDRLQGNVGSSHGYSAR